MAQQYRRPLLSLYLAQPPQKGDRGVDFRSIHGDQSPANEAVLDALVRNVRARQSMVRAILEDLEEDEPLEFVGAHSAAQGTAPVLTSLKSLIGMDLAAYRRQRNAADAFNSLRTSVESIGTIGASLSSF